MIFPRLLAILALLQLTIVNCQLSIAQAPKTFTHEPLPFFNEMKKYMEETNKQQGEDIMKEFKVIWYTDDVEPKELEKMYKEANKVLQKRMKDAADSAKTEYSPETHKLNDAQKQQIYKVADAMLKKRMKAFPDFKNYLFTLISFAVSNQPEESFNAFQQALDKMLERKVSGRKFGAFLIICEGLFRDNTLFKSVSTKWVASNNKYLFDFDSVPFIKFPAITLTCHAKGDSSVIYSTGGTYYPTEERWKGKGGRVDWRRAGISPDTIHAEINNYTIDMSSAKYTIDSVIFYNYDFFDKPLMGVLNDKLMANVTEDKASYPQFDSYNTNIVIKELHKNIDYEGGFSMHGAKFLGSGSKEKGAAIHVKRVNPQSKNIEEFIVARSKFFLIKKDRIFSEHSAVTLYYEKDSIYHPGLEFKFIVDKREMTFIRNGEGTAKSPYFDSYHKLDMYFDALYWKIDDPVITIRMLSGGVENKAVFESANYYDAFRFTKLQGLSEVNPLVRIKSLWEKELRPPFLVISDVCGAFRLSPEEVRPMLMQIANMGLITYNADEQTIELRDRLINYLNAKIGKTDYDVIQFNSAMPALKNNAEINLLNLDMTLFGVEQIYLSDSQNVYIFPKNQTVTVKKNRDFNFNGKVIAGRFDFYGKEFSFEYDPFKLNLNVVDSLRLKVPVSQPDEMGRVKLLAVKTVIRDMTGNIEIDKPYNKSGLKDYSQYPIFNSLKESYTYYDKESIQKGVYKKDNFYFQLTPFQIDSLDNFTAAGVAFDGTFTSANIFPDFKDTLRIQSDFSLGFVRDAPANGFPLYGGKGNYKKTIKLSHEGLRGNGEISYLASTTNSYDFVFFPDSMNTIAENFELKKTAGAVEYPHVRGDSVNVHWMPYTDQYKVAQLTKALIMYDGQAYLYGGITLMPTGLSGYGTMSFLTAELESKLYDFKENDFTAGISDFRLKAENSQALSFNSSDVRSHIDFKTRKGEFKSNRGSVPAQFPLNMYICYTDEFNWEMDKHTLEFVSDKAVAGTEETGTRFVSTHPNQDSLGFIAPYAKFDLKNYLISAEKVKQLEVADAYIYPDSGKVVIHQNAVMETLENAKILANTVTNYHKFYEATLNVTSRKAYTGSGSYDYVDARGISRAISFGKITVDSTHQTRGEAAILESDSFSLSPNFDYKGRAVLYASRQFLTFDGATRIKHNCEGFSSTWLSFKGEIDPKEIYIPIEKEPRDANFNRISTGIVFSKDSTNIYPTFLSRKMRDADVDIITAEGFLYYDNATSEYRISNKEKLKGSTVGGNYLSLSSRCIALAQGKLNLNIDLGMVKLNPVGTVSHNMNNDSTTFDIETGIDFFFNEQSLGVLIENLGNNFPPLNAIQFNANYEKGLLEYVGKERAEKLLSEINLYGAFKKFPEELGQTLFLTDVKFKWEKSMSAYRYRGLVGIGSINKHQVNKYVWMAIELVKKRSGDILNIYIEPNNDTWYFFNYSRGLMAAISSKAEFNDFIKNVKPEKRIIKGEKGGSYEYILSSEIKKRDFLRTWPEKGK